MASRRRGLGGVPLTKNPTPHQFESTVLRRSVDLNSEEARRHLVANRGFATEVGAYIDKIVAKNSTPVPPLRGVVPLLSKGKLREVAERVDIPVEPATPDHQEAADLIAHTVDDRMSTIDADDD
jgi:hypothetical protein